MNGGIITMNVIGPGNKIMTDNKLSPWIMYWDGDTDIYNAITNDKDFRDIVMHYAMKLDVYDDAVVHWSAYCVNDGQERHDNGKIPVKDFLDVESSIECQAMMLSDILMHMTDKHIPAYNIISCISKDTILNYVRNAGRMHDKTYIAKILISNIDFIIRHIKDKYDRQSSTDSGADGAPLS